MNVDLVTMTGNVAQVFLTDEDWLAALRGVRDALGTDGHLVFEVRDPAFRGWEECSRYASTSTITTGLGTIECWAELTEVALPLVSFRWTCRFLNDDTVLVSDSTLRFQSKDEVIASLSASGFMVDDVRDAPDRPNSEFVFIASPEG